MNTTFNQQIPTRTIPATRLVILSRFVTTKPKKQVPFNYQHVRPQELQSEKIGDCVVRAFTYLSKLPYKEVEKYLAENHGYSPSRGAFVAGIMEKENNQIFGLSFTEIYKRKFAVENGQLIQKVKGMSLDTFLKRHSWGHYLVTVSKHCFVVSNGAVVDNWRQKAGRHLTAVWRLNQVRI
jgi:hypothetical protein